MTHLRLTLLAVCLGGMLLAACQASGPAMAGRAFLSVNVAENGAPKALVAGTRIRLDFQADALSANAGCNTMGGTYRLDGGRLVVGDLAMTEMGCQPELMAQDTWLAGVLGAKPQVVLVGDELTIDAGTAVIVLKDRRVVQPDLAITGPTWTVESLFTGDAVSSVPAGAVATLVFHADGTLDVDDGCNTGGAHWAPVGTGIEVSDLVLTKKACSGAAAELESAVVGTLREGTIAASIEADQLILRAGASGLGLRGR